MVDYSTRTWSTRTVEDGLNGAVGLGLGEVRDIANHTPAAIAHNLNDGSWVVVGHSTVDGQSALALELEGSTGPYGVSGGIGTIWVNASTYLVLRTVEVSSDLATRGGAAIGHTVTTTDVSWIPQTPASLADLQIQIPAGFTEVTGPPWTS